MDLRDLEWHPPVRSFVNLDRIDPVRLQILHRLSTTASRMNKAFHHTTVGGFEVEREYGSLSSTRLELHAYRCLYAGLGEDLRIEAMKTSALSPKWTHGSRPAVIDALQHGEAYRHRHELQDRSRPAIPGHTTNGLGLEVTESGAVRSVRRLAVVSQESGTPGLDCSEQPPGACEL